MSSRRLLGSFVLALLCAACESGTEVDTSGLSGPCAQTYEFGNFGCARIVVILTPPSDPLPPLYRLTVRSVFVNPRSEATLASAGDRNTPLQPIPLTLTLWNGPLVAVGDTASVWVVAKVYEERATTGQPLALFAADSTRITAKFSPVGSAPHVDTVHLVLKRP